MATKDYLPQGWADLAEWYQNFALNLAALAAKYNVDAAAQTSVANDNNWLQYWVGAKFTAKQQEKQLTDYTDQIADGEPGETAPTTPEWKLPPTPPPEVAPGLRRRVRQLANQIKTSSVYTEADGALLGIINSGGEIPPAEIKAAFSAYALANYAVAFEFKKQGMDGMQFETRKAGEIGWNIVGTRSTSPAKLIIPAAAPAQIEIRSVLVKKDNPVGSYSDIVTVTIAP